MTGEPAFRLVEPPLLSRSAVDRFEALRLDVDRQVSAWPRARILLVDEAGRVPVRSGGTALVFQAGADVAAGPPTGAVLLGERHGIGYWAVRVRGQDGAEPADPARGHGGVRRDAHERWCGLRDVGEPLGSADAGLVATAVAVLNWQRDSRFCGRCGAPVEILRAGWASRCTGCGHEEYPRTDPAVICLVHDGVGVNGEYVLLARQPSWPPDRYSVLAGFVEAGESLEDCVVREIAEEVGLTVREVRYLGNQPWPFPRSLMLAFTAVADRSAPLRLADGEIEAARWVSRAEVRAVLAAGGAYEGLGLPSGVSIARHMLQAWARPSTQGVSTLQTPRVDPSGPS